MNSLRQIIITIDGVEKKVLAQAIGKKFWCNVDQNTFCFDISDFSASGTQRNKKSQTKAPHLITAPMPGKITKIFARAGATVAKSQALLVMEAMKMEYTLKSELSTTIEKVNVKVGDQVTLGALLVELKAEGSK